MNIDFAAAIKEVDRTNQAFQWKKGFHPFWEAVGNRTLREDLFQSFIKDLEYFYTRTIEFSSAALHRNLSPEIMFPLSADLVQLIKLDLDKTPDIHLDITLGIESICNHLLMTAETDYYSYFASLYTLTQLIFNREEFNYIIERNNQTNLNKFFFQLQKAPATLSQIQAHFFPLDQTTFTRILHNNYTLCETIDYWLDEILTEHKKSMIPVYRSTG